MKKKNYLAPTIRVRKLHVQRHLLAGSLGFSGDTESEDGNYNNEGYEEKTGTWE